MPKATVSKIGEKNRHDPLHVQLNKDEVVSKYGKVSKPGKRPKKGDSDEDVQQVHCQTRLVELYGQ